MSDVCQGCGKCCDEQGTPPMMPGEYDALPNHIRWDTLKHAGRYDEGLPCLWYSPDTKRCLHYEHRPQVCRDFTPGEPSCNKWRVELGLIPLPPQPESC